MVKLLWDVSAISIIGEEFFDENEKHHRENDLPAIILNNGSKYWYQHGKRHRVGNPAVIWKQKSKLIAKAWYENGLLHRINGPAIEWADGRKSYYQNGIFIK